MAGFITRFGTTFGVGALGACVASIPAAIRVGAGDMPACGAYNAWLVLAGAGLGPMLVAVALLRGARVGLKAFGGPGQGPRFTAFLLWAGLELGMLVLLGALLRATTHHHALAGVTFALVSLLGSVGLAVFSVRTVAVVLALPDWLRPFTVGMGLLVLSFTVALAARRAGLDAPGSMGVAGATIVDLLAFFIVATFASRAQFVEARWLALLGPPAAATLLVLGVSAFRACPQIAEAASGHAPLYSQTLVRWQPH
jgi:hypothetical protein